MKKLLVLFGIMLFAFTLSACRRGTDEEPDQTLDWEQICAGDDVVVNVINGGFETGDLTGWTAEGDAFDDNSVTTLETFWQQEIPFGHEGNFHLFGRFDGMYEDGTIEYKSELKTGTLTSSTFTLCGDGMISFKLGAARNTDTLFVEVRLAENDQLIARQSNTEFADFSGVVDPQQAINGYAFVNNYADYKLDLSDVDGVDYRGHEMYVVLVDNADHADFGYINFDDLRTYYVDGVADPQEPGDLDNFDYIRIVCDDLVADSIYEIINPGFETGNLCGWEVIEGDAFAHAGVNSEPTWWDEEISYNRDGDYHYGMYNESATGIMNSSVFELGGSGYMSFLLGGNGGYISIIDADTDEELARFTNTEFADINFPNPEEGMRLANMQQYYVDLTQFAELGTELYIQVVDNRASGWGLMTLDSFFTYHPQPFTEGVEAIDQLTAIDCTGVEANSIYEIINPGFETGNLCGWDVLEGEAFAHEGVNSEATWWAEEIPYNRDGDYHYGMYREDQTGIMNSSVFELGGSGYMSFLLGGNGGYISIMDATTHEELARFTNTEFADINFPNPDEGMRLANMQQYYIDLTLFAELGTELYIQIVDNKTSDWGVMTFDSFFTYHVDPYTEGVEAINQLADEGEEEEDPEAASIYEIVNPGFETGTLAGWTVIEGEAFADAGVNSDETFWAEEISYNRDGDYHYGMYNEEATGIMNSSVFELGGSGYMSFLLGGNGGYISIMDATTHEELARFYNSEFSDTGFPNPEDGMRLGNMQQYYVNLTQFAELGTELYIQIVDNKTSDWGVMTFDSFFTYHETPYTEGVEAINQLPDEGEEEEDPETTTLYEVENAGFETGDLTGWTVIEGEAFADAGVNSDETFWAEEIPYNRDGNYHYGMYNEEATGIMNSSVFVLGGSGYMSFLLGGNGGYISIMDATTHEELARFYNSEFADINFPNPDEGMRLANMQQYYIDLTLFAELGTELYIQIVDNKTSDWGVMTFDSFFTYHVDPYTEGVEAINQLPQD